MGLRFIDGFDQYNAASDLALKYTTVITNPLHTPVFYGGILAQGAGRYAGFSLKSQGMAPCLFFPAAQPSWTVGVAFKYDSLDMLPLVVLSFNFGTSPQVQVYLDTGGRLTVGQGQTSPPTIISTGSAKTGPTALVAGIWHYVEAKITTSGGAMTAMEIRLNGSPEVVWAGSKSVLAIDAVMLGDPCNNNRSTSDRAWLDDIYILDGTGAANNTFLGDVRVETLYPTGAGSSTQFTPVGDANNYATVNTPGGQDADAKYVKSSTSGQVDLYAMGDLSTNPSLVAAVAVSVIARKDDAGTRTFRAVVRRGGTTYESAATDTLNSTYRNFQDIFDVDPSTGVPWDKAGVDAMEAGIKLLS